MLNFSLFFTQAPEAFTNKFGGVTCKIDVYSFAVILKCARAMCTRSGVQGPGLY